MNSSIHLAPVLSSDVPLLGRIYAEAFSQDPLRLFMFSHGPDHKLTVQRAQARYRKDYGNETKRFLKARDERSGEIVGFITWTVKVQGQEDEEEPTFPPPLNEAFNKAVFGRFQRQRTDFMKGKKYIHFNTLAVSPDRQRQGIGKMLMTSFVTYADREGLPTYLNSQMVAHKLYRRLGFEDVGSIDTDLEVWGPGRELGVHRVVCMLRSPQT